MRTILVKIDSVPTCTAKHYLNLFEEQSKQNTDVTALQLLSTCDTFHKDRFYRVTKKNKFTRRVCCWLWILKKPLD